MAYATSRERQRGALVEAAPARARVKSGGRGGGPERGAPALFDGLPADVFETLLERSKRRPIARGGVLYHQGESVDHLFYVESGSFKRVLQSDSGKELIVGLAGPGELLGAWTERALADSQVQALERGQCLAVPVTVVRWAIARTPDLAVRLLRHLEAQKRGSEAMAATVVFESVPERLAGLIRATSDPATGHLRFPLTQTEIAHIIGSSRETVCSILNRFQREGSIELERGRIRVLDGRRLL